MKSEIISNLDGTFIVFPNDAIAQHLKRGDLWEPHFNTVISKFIKPGDTVIDCGANFGYNSVLMGNRIKESGKLFSFEPQRIIYQQLSGNLILNNIYNAITFQLALGDKEGDIQMSPIDYEQSWVNIGDLSIGYGGEKVKIIKLDNLLDEVDTVNFLKLDIQGYELFVLKGAFQILSVHKPDIFIEIEDHQLAKFDITRGELISYIKSFGYRIFNINNDYPADYICTINNIHLIDDLQKELNLIEI